MIINPAIKTDKIDLTVDEFEHIDWCVSHGPYMADDCDCPCPCETGSKRECPRHPGGVDGEGVYW